MSEECWLALARRGDRAAFDRIAVTYRPLIHKISSRYFSVADDRDDVTQEVLHRVWTHLADFRGESSFKSWVFTVAINQCLNALRGRKSAISIDDLVEADTPTILSIANISDDAISAIMRQQFLDKVRIAGSQKVPPWDELDEAIFFLFIFREYSLSDIAKSLAQNPNTIRSRFQRNIRPVITSVGQQIFGDQYNESVDPEKQLQRKNV